MIRGTTWIIFLVVNLVFIALYARMFITTYLVSMKRNWSKYRCNPLALPFSDDPGKDFVFCVQNIQSSYMKYLMQPLNYMFDSLGSLAINFDLNILDIRKMFNYVRNQIMFIIKSTFGVMMTIIIEFQRIIMNLKDLFGKMIGIMEVVKGTTEGAIMTGQSAWDGPPGGMIRTLGGLACFLPETKLKLNNGTIKYMKDLSLGDVLDDGSIVQCVMKLSNFGKDIYHKFEGKGVDGEDIYVTGRHFVQGHDGMFTYVEKHPDSIPVPTKEVGELSCLITDKHRISIGNMMFWDWEDDILYNMLYNT